MARITSIEDVKTEIWKYVVAGAGFFILLLVVIAAFGMFYNVPAGYVGVKFSKFGPGQGFDYNELPQGYGFKVPFMQVVYDMPFQTQTIGFYGGTEERGTFGALVPMDKNGITYEVDLTVRYRLDPNQAAEFTEQKGVGVPAMEQILSTAARADSTRGVLGQYSQEEVPTIRSELSQEIMKALQKRVDSEASRNLKPGFITIEAVDIRDIRFNQQISERIITKQTLLQEAQGMVYKLETATKQKEIEIVNADRDKQAAILRAEGEGESIKIVAFAKADGIEAVNKAYQDMPYQYVLTKAYEAIQPTDKVYLGFESLSMNTLPILDLNKVMGQQIVRQNITG